MSCWNKQELENMLEDVINELELSDSAIEKHGPLGTPPAELVRLVLDEKDLIIRGLKSGFKVHHENFKDEVRMKYKLTIYPVIDKDHSKKILFQFETNAELLAAKNSTADLLLFLQDEMKIMPDSSNIFVCEKLVDGEWEEIDE